MQKTMGKKWTYGEGERSYLVASWESLEDFQTHHPIHPSF